MSRRRQFTLEYWQDEDWYVGRLREIPGVFSQAETLEDLEENIREAYHLMLEDGSEVVEVGPVHQKDIEVEV